MEVRLNFFRVADMTSQQGYLSYVCVRFGGPVEWCHCSGDLGFGLEWAELTPSMLMVYMAFTWAASAEPIGATPKQIVWQ